MKLPNAEAAHVDRRKVELYLLSPTHPVGRSKAALLCALGFSESDASVLTDALLNLGRTGEAWLVADSAYGRKYVVDGVISSPLGREIKLRTIWIIEKGQTNPRFVTAYPF